MNDWLKNGLLLGLLILVANSCTRSDPSVIRFGLANAPLKLDPRFVTDAIPSRVCRLLYRQLVDFDAHARPVPALAEWKVLSPIHLRFRLREQGRLFHNGDRLTATDVKATYDSVLDPKTASPHRLSVALIKRIDVLDAETFDMHLHRADPAFVGYLVIGILPAQLLHAKHPFSTHPLGSGEFRLHHWSAIDRLQLKRVRDGQVIEFVHINNGTTRILKALRGELDILQNDLPNELVNYLSHDKNIRILRRPGTNFSYLGLNLQDKRLRHLDIRRAIAHAINRPALVRAMFGPETRLANALFTPEHWAGNPKLSAYNYDPERARQLLAKHGFSRENPLKLVYKTTTDPFRVRIATIFQHQLGNVGIQVKLRTLEFGTFYADIKKGNFDLYSLAWIGVKSPDMFRTVYHSASIPTPNNGRQGANRNHYRDPEVDRWIEQAERSRDETLRVQLFQKLHARLLDQLPVIPLWYEEQVAVLRQRIEGYTLDADGNYDSLLYVKIRPGSP